VNFGSHLSFRAENQLNKRWSTSKFQRLVARIWLVVVIAIALFPPCLGSGRDTAYPNGHHFLFETTYYPHRRTAMPWVDSGRLLAYWGLASAVAGLTLVWQARTPKPKPSRPGIDPPDEFPGVGTTDSEST
jgi:hypothetical protein